MMESHGVTKVKYAKICDLDNECFPGCNVIQYDEGVTPDGDHLKFNGVARQLRQSNDKYETEMREVDEKEVKFFIANKKFGL